MRVLAVTLCPRQTRTESASPVCLPMALVRFDRGEKQSRRSLGMTSQVWWGSLRLLALAECDIPLTKGKEKRSSEVC